MRQFVLFLIFTLSSLYAEETITLRNEAEYCVINSNEISFLYYKIGEGESEITCQNQIQTEYSIPFVYSNKANKKICFLIMDISQKQCFRLMNPYFLMISSVIFL